MQNKKKISNLQFFLGAEHAANKLQNNATLLFFPIPELGCSILRTAVFCKCSWENVHSSIPLAKLILLERGKERPLKHFPAYFKKCVRIHFSIYSCRICRSNLFFAHRLLLPPDILLQWQRPRRRRRRRRRHGGPARRSSRAGSRGQVWDIFLIKNTVLYVFLISHILTIDLVSKNN